MRNWINNLSGGNNMPWTAQSGNTYQLVLLDTNALSVIVKNKKKEGLGFVTKFDASSYVPCFTVYNLIEIRRNEKAYESFMKFFAIYPSFILKPGDIILKDEVAAYDREENVSVLFNAFTPIGKGSTYKMQSFVYELFQNPAMMEIEKNWRKDESLIMESWLDMKKNFEPTSDAAKKEDADRYVNDALFQELCKRFPEFVQKELDNKKIPDVWKFPSLQAMLYSQYYRIFDTNRNCTTSDVTDVRIMAASPYVDVVITENYQAELFKKFKAKVPLLRKLRVVRVGDLKG
jgi:hypothetical protein